VTSGKKENTSTLNGVLDSSWKILHKGVADFSHPFYRASLTTMDGNKPQLRTVILRGFSEKDRSLICHCDARTPKVSQVRKNPNVSWLFYHPKKWLQLRLSGIATIHTDDEMAESQWKEVKLHNRINYSAQIPPGSPTAEPISGLPDYLRDNVSKLQAKSNARKNFAVIVCHFDELDWLQLKLTGHIRAKFHWIGDRMDASWLIP
jgi:pyridoxamine 5'-phosphate oxidase